MAGVSSRKALALAQAGLVALVLASVAPMTAQAQQVPPSSPSAPVPDPAPGPAVVPDAMGDDFGTAEPAVPAMPGPPAYVAELPAAPARMRTIDVIRESIFGEASVDGWQPLSLSTFFTEGWDRPWAKSPPGSNGAYRQNWFGAADAAFVRLSSLNFSYVNGMTTNPGLLLTPVPWSPAKPLSSGNEYWASYNLYLPLNQRLELLVAIPFVASNPNKAGHYVGNFGDLTISERFRLIEQRDFTLLALLTERTPTGQTINGNDINFITPSAEFWWNFAPKWAIRGSTGMNIDTGRHSATSVYFNNLAIGRHLTDQNARIFKELTVHVSVTTLSDVLGRKDYITDVYIAPGLRFALDREQKWYALGCVFIPVAGPQPYAWQSMFALARTF